MHIAVLVLAAGKSSRMGSIKQLSKVGDKYLLDIVLEKAKKIASERTFCVLGANLDTIKNKINLKDVTTVINNSFDLGLSSSIIRGLKTIMTTDKEIEGILILLGDQPAIAVSYLEEILKLSTTNPSKIIASKYSKNYGVPALIPKFYFEELLKIKGDKGAKKFLNNNPKQVITPNIHTNLIDIDTEKDLVSYLTQTR